MKKILASLLAAYAVNVNRGQAPPGAVPPGLVPGAVPPAPAVPVAPVTTRLAAATTAAATEPATTSAPITTAAATAAATTSAPAATAPATTAAATAAATTSAPATTAAATAAATTSAPAATAAATTAAATLPATTAAATAAATTAAPVTTAAATMPATTAAATTAAPVATMPATTAAATTAAPVTTQPPPPPINLLCPAGSGVGRPTGFQSADQACLFPGQRAQDFMGNLRCDQYSCCFCEHVTCGYQGYPCESMQFGDYGAIGVQSLWLDGRFAINTNGATLECNGRESCKKTKIIGNDIWKASCGSDFACDGAHIELYNPRPDMEFAANGQYSLKDATVDIIIGEPGTECPPGFNGAAMVGIKSITFNGFEAALNAVVTVKNFGCSPVRIGTLECGGLTACPNLDIRLEGNIVIQTCSLPGLVNVANLPPQLQACVQGLGSMPIPPQTPIVPGVTPPNFTPLPPVQPPPTNLPPTNLPPTNPVVPPTIPQPPTTPGQLPGPILAPGYSAKLACDGMYTVCSGQQLRIPIQNNFVLEGALPNSARDAHIILEAGIDPHTLLPVERIDSLKLIGVGSGANTMIEIVDTRPAYPGMLNIPIKIDDLRCENPCTCNGLSIVAGPGINLFGMNADCSEPEYCIGCTLTQNGITMPCNPMAPMLPPGAPPMCPMHHMPGMPGMPGVGMPVMPAQYI